MSRHHSIDYVEIPVHDLTAAKSFYTAAFGWELTDYGPTYCGIRGEGEREMGGLVLSEDVRPGGPLVILYSDDLEASVAAVEAAGGRVLTPPYEFPGGRRFELEDPSGHRLAVWTAAT